jgi:hypothetical protein
MTLTPLIWSISLTQIWRVKFARSFHQTKTLSSFG